MISLILGSNFFCIIMGGCFMLCSCDSCGGGPSREGTDLGFGLGDIVAVNSFPLMVRRITDRTHTAMFLGREGGRFRI